MKLLVFLTLANLAAIAAFSKQGRPDAPILADKYSDNGKEVCITDFLAAGDPEGAREATRVVDLFPQDIESYSGFALVNETAKNKLFFWYVPAIEKNESAPLLIWLQGGPGGSSMFGMFAEMGPYSVAEDGVTLIPRLSTWNRNQGMIFIDNPVGAGYSYTETEDGYCTNTKVEVSSQLYELMQQFYQVFPEQLKQDLYITGESYAGHYVPGIAYKIYSENKNIDNSGKLEIPLKGLAIGDGWVDPYSQLSGYPDMLFNIGMANTEEKKKYQEYIKKTQDYIEQGLMYEAFTVWDEMINNDIYPYPNYFHNRTGSNDYDNFMNIQEPAELNYYSNFITASNTRQKIHTGDAIFNDGSDCEINLLSDFMVSFKREMSELMENYKVLVYSGQLDVIIGAALTELMIPTIEWSGREKFLSSTKKVWRLSAVDSDVAGYVQQADRFTYALVRGAGHLVPYDQPERSLNMIERWIKDVPFTDITDPK